MTGEPQKPDSGGQKNLQSGRPGQNGEAIQAPSGRSATARSTTSLTLDMFCRRAAPRQNGEAVQAPSGGQRRRTQCGKRGGYSSVTVTQ